MDICCVGIVCADILGKPVDGLPERGKLKYIDNLVMQIGGCAANLAVGAAKLSASCGIVAALGKDGFGDFIGKTLKAAGVETKGIMRISAATSASFVAIDSKGERTILHNPGANGVFTAADIDLNFVAKAKYLFIAGTFLMPAFDGGECEKLLRFAKGKGLICCMDTAWDSTGAWLKKIGGSLKYLDWFMPSFDEAKEMSGESEPPKIAAAFKRMGAKNIVVKLGKDGCYVEPENAAGFYSPTFKGPVADTSGAGDSFCAGFITALSKGWDLKKCAEFANAVGTCCVSKIGTTAGIKSMDETLEFIGRTEREKRA